MSNNPAGMLNMSLDDSPQAASKKTSNGGTPDRNPAFKEVKTEILERFERPTVSNPKKVQPVPPTKQTELSRKEVSMQNAPRTFVQLAEEHFQLLMSEIRQVKHEAKSSSQVLSQFSEMMPNIDKFMDRMDDSRARNDTSIVLMMQDNMERNARLDAFMSEFDHQSAPAINGDSLPNIMSVPAKKPISCLFCMSDTHLSMKCRNYKNYMYRRARLEILKICWKCLKSKESSEHQCSSTMTCGHCVSFASSPADAQHPEIVCHVKLHPSIVGDEMPPGNPRKRGHGGPSGRSKKSTV